MKVEARGLAKCGALLLAFSLAAAAQSPPLEDSSSYERAPYQTALPGYHYEFPRDHFDHPAYQTEWWYYTGNVSGADGHRFGFELTFFRQGVNRDAAKDKTWDVKDMYLAHFALSDLDGEKFYHTERLNREGPHIAGASAMEQRVWNGNWQAKWSAEDQQLQAIDAKFEILLNLHAEKPPVIHGENGVSQKSAGAGHASHYISLTRLSTNGEIKVNGQAYRVSGLTWMDHEFFTTALDAEQLGWNWLSIQLADNTELMLYDFRRKDGGVDAFSSGTYVDAQGHATHLRASDFRLQPTGATWKSAVTGATYPIAWSLAIPQLGITLETKTSLPNQELTGQSNLAPSYWEGAITLTGTRGGQAISGVGYLELTGYERPIHLQ